MKLVADGEPWREVQAFMHSMAYGNAREYVETFDWKAGEKKAQAEAQAWADVIQAQVDKLEARSKAPPVQIAFLGPGLPPGVLAPPVATPVVPPMVQPMAPLAPVAEGIGTRLLTFAAARGLLLLGLLLWSTELNSGEDAWLRKRDEALKKKRLLIRDIQEEITVVVNSTNNECRPQRTNNQENGAECENDGYVLMESVLRYTRLVDPPKGRGLDGLFEKLAPDDQPWPFPETVTVPKPGKLVFIPEEAEPPKQKYDFTGKPPRTLYPKFVVFEAKNVSMAFDERDKDGIQKESKNRLGNTCDGQQVGVRWTVRRIPQALNRQAPGAKNKKSRDQKLDEIRDARYARWIFVCLPGPVGSNTKLYVFIDVVASGMDLESKAPIPRKGKTQTPGSGNNNL